MGEFGYNYSKSRPTKYRGQEPKISNKFNIWQDTNAIVNNAVYDIILQENNKPSVEYESHEKIDSEFD